MTHKTPFEILDPLKSKSLSVRGKKLKQGTLALAGFTSDEVIFKDVRLKGLEQDVTYLGYISSNGKTELMPSNSTRIQKDDKLVFIE